MINLTIRKEGNSYPLDMEENTNITYNKVAQDFSEVQFVQSSYAIDFPIPKTSHNLEVFNLLSLIGDTSSDPYQEIRADLSYNGHQIVVNARFILVSSTKDYITAGLKSETIDFNKSTENLYFGKDIDLSELNHDKNIRTILESNQKDLPYCYILADYNGDMAYIKDEKEIIDINYLIPSVKVSYLWQKMFDKIGFTYSGKFFDTDEFKSSFITLPTVTKTDVEQEGSIYINDNKEKSELEKTQQIGSDNKPIKDRYVFKYSENSQSRGEYNEDRTSYIVPESGEYTLEFTSEITGEYGYWTKPVNNDFPLYKTTYSDVNEVDIMVNGEVKGTLTKESTSIKLKLEKSDKVTLIMRLPSSIFHSLYMQNPAQLGKIKGTYNLSLIHNNRDSVEGNKFFEKLLVDDFIKEMYRRFALIPFATEDPKKIDFLTFEERFLYQETTDLSQFYIERTEETYDFETYAQNNFYKHKYNKKDADYNNGNIQVNNINLEGSKTSYESKFYTYNEELSEYKTFRGTHIVPIYDVELSIKTTNGKKELEYKYNALSDRFYIIKRKKLGNEVALSDPELSANISYSNDCYIIDTEGTDYKTIISNNYKEVKRILDDLRILSIDLNLNVLQDEKFDLRHVYYFDQEKGYYILSRLVYDIENEKAQGTFIRLKR